MVESTHQSLKYPGNSLVHINVVLLVYNMESMRVENVLGYPIIKKEK